MLSYICTQLTLENNTGVRGIHAHAVKTHLVTFDSTACSSHQQIQPTVD